MSAFETGVEVTRLLEQSSDYTLTCAPFMTHVDYEPGEAGLTTGGKLRRSPTSTEHARGTETIPERSPVRLRPMTGQPGPTGRAVTRDNGPG